MSNQINSSLRYSKIVAIALIFFLGWQSASYYLKSSSITEIKKTEEKKNVPGILSNSLKSEDLKLLFEVWDILKNDYVEEKTIDKDEQVYGAIRGMVDSLEDPYTAFMTPDQTQEFQNNLDGNLEGIGVEVTIENQNLVVVSPIKGSPAEKANVKPGDIIYEIEGEETSQMSLYEAIMRIRGDKGTLVHLTILREGEKTPLDVSIVRDSIQIESLSWEEKDGDIAYIAINQFSDSTLTELQIAINEILLKEPKGLIIDLRYNGGGYLDIAVDILGELIEGKKKAVIIKQRESKNEDIYLEGKGHLADIPLVVLVNYGSASASEILAGAVQDYKRGVVIGEQTFGKGSVQEVITLEDGSSLRMTIAKWFTPLGRTIDHVGIQPDRVVEFTEKDVETETDPQLEAALQYLHDNSRS